MVRPDLAEVTSQLPRGLDKITRDDVLILNKVIEEEKLQRLPSIVLFPACLDILKWRLLSFCDASMLTDRRAARAGCIVFLGNGGEAGTFYGAPLYWHSRKLPRVANSSFDGENQAMREGADATIHIKLLLSYLGIQLCVGHGFNDGIRIVTDHKGVVDHLRSIKGTRARGYPELDILALRNLMESKAASLGWTDTTSNLADGLTKLKYPNPDLRQVLADGICRFCPPGTDMDRALEDFGQNVREQDELSA